MGLAGHEDPVRPAPSCIAPWSRAKTAKAVRVALAGARRTLDQQHRRPAVLADELPLAGLEVVQQPGVAEGVQPGQERRLARRAGAVAGRRGRHQPVVEDVRLAGAQPVDDLGAPVAVPVVRARDRACRACRPPAAG